MALQLDFGKLSYSPQWYEFDSGDIIENPADDDTRVMMKIRPHLSSSADVVVKDSGVVISGKEQCKKFKHSLMDWRNINGPDDQPLVCNDKVKQQIFDYDINKIPVFVMRIARRFEEEKAEDEKN